MTFLIAIVGLLGHATVCIALINRMHGVGMNRPALRMCDAVWYSFAVGVPIGIFGLYRASVGHVWARQFSWHSLSEHPFVWLAALYTVTAIVAAFVGIGFRVSLAWKLQHPTSQIVGNHTQYVSIEKNLGRCPAGDLLTSWLAAIPGNQIMDLSIHRKTICLPRLDSALTGLSITHLTDLHFTGQLQKEFFVEVVRQSNMLASDIVAITGDIIDKPHCLEWIPEVLGQLDSRLGVYFVLGNHDKQIRDDALVRRKLTDAGLIDLGGTTKRIEHAGQPIVLAGNETPWYRPAANLQFVPTGHNGIQPLRILLTHTPDNLAWARERDVDLMLAGHTHGGQVRFPWIGPVLSPSRFGVRHASGTFMCDPTLLHVSRGISGTRPLRINCPPELAQLVLQSPTAGD